MFLYLDHKLLFLFLKREKEHKTSIFLLLFQIFMHSLVACCCALTRDRTCNLGVLGTML